MAAVSWGKPKIWISKLGSNGSPTTWSEIPTPVEGTTTLATTKGDKKEAKIEGGENEAVKYNRNNFALEFTIRAVKGRSKLAEDKNGVIDGDYALKLQPEDASVQGLSIAKGTLSFEPTYSAEDGIQWKYTLDALVPDDPDTEMVEFEVITDPTQS